jgi:hypothetical protein
LGVIGLYIYRNRPKSPTDTVEYPILLKDLNRQKYLKYDMSSNRFVSVENKTEASEFLTERDDEPGRQGQKYNILYVVREQQEPLKFTKYYLNLKRGEDLQYRYYPESVKSTPLFLVRVVDTFFIKTNEQNCMKTLYNFCSDDDNLCKDQDCVTVMMIENI